jgi:hypothetical protein
VRVFQDRFDDAFGHLLFDPVFEVQGEILFQKKRQSSYFTGECSTLMVVNFSGWRDKLVMADMACLPA